MPTTHDSPRITAEAADRELAVDRPPTPPPRGGPRWLRILFVVAVLVLVAVALLPRLTTWLVAHDDVVHRVSEVPPLEDGERRVAIVLGAGLLDRRPSPLLEDRIDAALELLDDGRVDMLLMTGDNTTEYYDEPSAMRRSAIEKGAPVRRVAVDYAGRRTWDSCVRAHEVFGIEEAVVVTNAFHVDRAVVACRAAGIDVTGMSVDDSRHGRSARASWRVRELAATGRALLDAWLLRPEPAVGGEDIDPYEPCELYRSFAPSVREDAADEFRQFGCG